MAIEVVRLTRIGADGARQVFFVKRGVPLPATIFPEPQAEALRIAGRQRNLAKIEEITAALRKSHPHLFK